MVGGAVLDPTGLVALEERYSDTDAQGEHQGKMVSQNGALPLQAKEGQGLPEAKRKAWERFSLRALKMSHSW